MTRDASGMGKQPTARYSSAPDVAEGNLSIELAIRGWIGSAALASPEPISTFIASGRRPNSGGAGSGGVLSHYRTVRYLCPVSVLF
jgi:hypothetical protein